MSFASLKMPDQPRQQLRANLAQVSNVPPARIDEVVDIACHAATSARVTMLEVIDRASDPRVSTTALGVALGLLRVEIEILEGALKSYAEAKGKPVHHCTLQVGGQANAG